MADTIGTRRRQLPSKGANANDTREQDRRDTFDKGGFNVQGTDISFTSPATISSAGNAMPTGLIAGDLIKVTGSGVNNRIWEVATVAAGSITVIPQKITTESAGALIDIRMV